MSDLKKKLDEMEQTTSELPPKKIRQLLEAEGARVKDTVPEIPVEYMLAREREKASQHSKGQRENLPGGSQNASVSPPEPTSETETDAGVYIRVGKKKMVWVEGEKKDDESDTSSGKIFG